MASSEAEIEKASKDAQRLSQFMEEGGEGDAVLRGGCCGTMLKAWRDLLGQVAGTGSLRLRAQQHGPSLPPSSDGNRAKPGIPLPPGKQGAIPHTGRTLRGDGPVSLHRPLQTAGQDGWLDRKGYRDAEGLK